MIVLASGQQLRWGGHDNKHLVPIHGEPLLLRTLRQVRRHCATRPVVVTHCQPTIDTINGVADVLTLPAETRRWATETALCSCPSWGDPTWLLLGDVYWTDEAIGRLFNISDDRPPQYFISAGTKGWDEILGVWFRGAHGRLMTHVLYHAVLDAERGGRGKLWESYRSLCGFRLPKHRLENEHRFPIDDESTDFDTWDECQSFVERHSQTAA